MHNSCNQGNIFTSHPDKIILNRDNLSLVDLPLLDSNYVITNLTYSSYKIRYFILNISNKKASRHDTMTYKLVEYLNTKMIHAAYTHFQLSSAYLISLLHGGIQLFSHKLGNHADLPLFFRPINLLKITKNSTKKNLSYLK